MSRFAPALEELLPLADALRPALLRVSRMLRREAQRAGFSILDAHLLAAVKKHEGIGAGALAASEQMTPASMSAHVKRLEQAGWIERSVPPDGDRRRMGLRITAKGSKALDVIRRRRRDWLASQLAHLDEAERSALAAAVGPLARLTEDR